MKAGDTVYLNPMGNARRFRGGDAIETKITKVARKYFYVDYYDNRFLIENMKHDNGDYSSQYECFLSEKEIQEHKERNKLSDEIKRKLREHYGVLSYPIEDLREIARLLQVPQD